MPQLRVYHFSTSSVRFTTIGVSLQTPPLVEAAFVDRYISSCCRALALVSKFRQASDYNNLVPYWCPKTDYS
jgi:hypothetical protein